ncbi:MAG: aldehyde dehydrogenase family protein [Alphaproteobacteria bacterium]
MPSTFQTISPVDGRVYVERPYATPEEITAALTRATEAQAAWALVPVAERAAICRRAVDVFVDRAQEIAEELAWQMGRPVRYGPGEVRGLEERARHMISIAGDVLADLEVGEKEGFTRFIRRAPLGVVLTIAPWNYPYLTAVNSIMPAVMAGNAVILKHASQTPLCAERFAEAFASAGLPGGVFQALHLTHEDASRVIGSPEIAFVAFTGSVPAGGTVERAAAGRFIGVGLELGGKDPAYVRADANLEHSIEGLVDGAFFNSGQSCCGIERIYVHESIYDGFVDGFADLTRQYRLGDPLDRETTLGPMVRTSAADFVRAQIEEAVSQGARPLIDTSAFPRDEPGTPYLAPQTLVDVDHSMRVMTEESFGPVVGIMAVGSDEEAIRLMNDSEYGLTASVWTADAEAAIAIGDRVDTGTWFMNRCDYLDPALAWTGVKHSGRGCALSRIGYEVLTRPKSYHLRTTI